MTFDGIDYSEPFVEISLQCFSLLVDEQSFLGNMSLVRKRMTSVEQAAVELKLSFLQYCHRRLILRCSMSFQ